MCVWGGGVVQCGGSFIKTHQSLIPMIFCASLANETVSFTLFAPASTQQLQSLCCLTSSHCWTPQLPPRLSPLLLFCSMQTDCPCKFPPSHPTHIHTQSRPSLTSFHCWTPRQPVRLSPLLLSSWSTWTIWTTTNTSRPCLTARCVRYRGGGSMQC